MATVIDSLIVELGLDASKFTSSQKKATEDLKKFEDTANRSNKSTQETTDKLAESFAGVGKSILALGGISLGMNSFKTFIGDMTVGNANLARSSNLIGKSAGELKAWGKVAETVNGSSEDMIQTFRSLQSNMTALKMGQGNTDFLTALSMLGIGGESWKKGRVDFLELAAALKKFKDTYGEGEAKNIADRLGLNDTAFYLLIQGKDQLKGLYEHMAETTKGTDEAAKAAERLQQKWAALKGEAGGLADNLFLKLAPAMESVVDSLARIFSPSQKGAIKKEHDALPWYQQGAFARNDFWNRLLGREQYAPKPGDDSGAAPSSSAPSGNKRLPRNLRNNNPGNIEYGPYAKSKGAIGSDGRFAIFPTPQAGEKAMSDLLSSYRSRGYDTIASIIGRWSPASDNAAGNTAAYISDVSRRTGIDPNQRLSDAQMFAVQHAMALHEGGIGAATNASGGMASAGGTQVQTTINTLNVNTQATDADGMARDAYKALSDHAFIGAGLAGAQ